MVGLVGMVGNPTLPHRTQIVCINKKEIRCSLVEKPTKPTIYTGEVVGKSKNIQKNINLKQ